MSWSVCCVLCFCVFVFLVGLFYVCRRGVLLYESPGGNQVDGLPPAFNEANKFASIDFFPKYAAKHRGSYLALGIGLNHPEARLLASLLACMAAWLVAWLPACLAGCLLACLLAWLPACCLLAACLPGCLAACLVGWLPGLPACLSPAPPGWGIWPPPLEITLKRVVTFCSKYAVKVDVDFATLQRNGRFL